MIDDDEADDGAAAEGQARPIDKFRATAAGAVLQAGMLGLADALEGREREEVQIVVDYSGDPPFTDPIAMRLDPDDPADSIVVVNRSAPRTS